MPPKKTREREKRPLSLSLTRLFSLLLRLFSTAEERKKAIKSSALEPVRAPVDARRARAKLKRLPVCVLSELMDERFFFSSRASKCALPSLSLTHSSPGRKKKRKKKEKKNRPFQTKWPPSLPPRPCACWARPCGGSALALTPWERRCKGGLRLQREVRELEFDKRRRRPEGGDGFFLNCVLLLRALVRRQAALCIFLSRESRKTIGICRLDQRKKRISEIHGEKARRR